MLQSLTESENVWKQSKVGNFFFCNRIRWKYLSSKKFKHLTFLQSNSVKIIMVKMKSHLCRANVSPFLVLKSRYTCKTYHIWIDKTFFGTKWQSSELSCKGVAVIYDIMDIRDCISMKMRRDFWRQS